MGVPGLWDLLRPAATRHSLSHLSREAVLKNNNNLRAFTIGIDASIWIFHAQIPHHGENPFLRTIFYKITALLQQPVLPVFVFDGPDKPGRKRNQRVAGSFGTSDVRSRQFKELLDECGLEWWNAPGEAEAELAVMNRQGKIDAVLSDDVDALLFGANCLLRNNSPTLSGASANIAGKGDLRSYDVYRSSAICEMMRSKDGTKLVTEEDCRMAMILVALLAGGDYVPEGIETFGPIIAHGLAHAGFIDVLKLYEHDREAFETELSFAHGRMVEELRTGASGMIGRKNPARAKALSQIEPSSLFSTYALDAYLRPSTSPLNDVYAGWPGFGKGERSIRRGKARNQGRGDIEGFARACERFFEWGTKDVVVKKFASEIVGLYGSEIMTAARETMRMATISGESSPPLSQPSSQTSGGSTVTSFFQQIRSSQNGKPKAPTKEVSLPPGQPPFSVIKIVSTRIDPTDPDITEYRLSFTHQTYSDRVLGAMQGTRVDPKDLDAEMRAELGLRERSEDTVEVGPGLKDELRIWIPEYLVKGAWPGLVDQYEEELASKAAKKAGTKKTVSKEKTRKNDKVMNGIDSTAFKQFFTQPTQVAKVTTAPVSKRLHTSRTMTVTRLSSDSEIEIVEVLEKTRRHHPTSSISSTASLPRLPTKTPSPPCRKTRAVVRRTSTRRTKSPIRVGKKATVVTTFTDVIDLCSSEEETPKPKRNGVSATPTSATTPTLADPTTTTPARRRPRSTKKKPKAVESDQEEEAEEVEVEEYVTPSQLIQTRLDLPVLGPSSQTRIMQKQTSKTSPKKSTGKNGKYRYREISASEDEIVIDATGTLH